MKYGFHVLYMYWHRRVNKYRKKKKRAMRLSLLVSLFRTSANIVSISGSSLSLSLPPSLFCAFGQLIAVIGSARLFWLLGWVTAAVGLAQPVSNFHVPSLADQNKHSNTSWEWASLGSLGLFSRIEQGKAAAAVPSIDIDRVIRRSRSGNWLCLWVIPWDFCYSVLNQSYQNVEMPLYSSILI